MAIEPANLGENQAFERLAEPFRREIKLHSYRMLGSLHEAEDAVQETYLRAWRSFSSFEVSNSDEQGSFRAWLYRIATNACLNALEGRKHQQRYLPDQLAPAGPPKLEGVPALDVPWLEPYPDTNLEGFADDAPNPEARYTARESVQLAFVAAIQQLPPRQRAALMLCDVLGWASAEAASLLGGSTASINSALQRARETLSQRHCDRRPPLGSQPTPAQQKLLGRYLQAWEGHDVDGFVAVLKDDATAVMPPWLRWFLGREVIGTFFALAWKTCGGLHLAPTSANGQPAFAIYEFSSADKRWNAHSIHVLTLENDAISAMTLFIDPRLFRDFGLPLSLPDNANSGLRNLSHKS
ncbi:MAG: sigma-70 family RNA polymerase sigma factor [Candidatus Sulfotelmatobacter sp.]|jgi:RNA polymerase sigma-70 factor (ECF subfamily)